MKTSTAKKLIRQRGALVEHPFGTIKQTLGWSHYLVRGKEKVSGENALIMFTYNFKRLQSGKLEDIKAEIVAYITNFWLDLFYFYKIMFFLDFRGKKCYC
jgi:hypothetical protein